MITDLEIILGKIQSLQETVMEQHLPVAVLQRLNDAEYAIQMAIKEVETTTP